MRARKVLSSGKTPDSEYDWGSETVNEVWSQTLQIPDIVWYKVHHRWRPCDDGRTKLHMAQTEADMQGSSRDFQNPHV